MHNSFKALQAVNHLKQQEGDFECCYWNMLKNPSA